MQLSRGCVLSLMGLLPTASTKPTLRTRKTREKCFNKSKIMSVLILLNMDEDKRGQDRGKWLLFSAYPLCKERLLGVVVLNHPRYLFSFLLPNYLGEGQSVIKLL